MTPQFPSLLSSKWVPKKSKKRSKFHWDPHFQHEMTQKSDFGASKMYFLKVLYIYKDIYVLTAYPLSGRWPPSPTPPGEGGWVVSKRPPPYPPRGGWSRRDHPPDVGWWSLTRPPSYRSRLVIVEDDHIIYINYIYIKDRLCLGDLMMMIINNMYDHLSWMITRYSLYLVIMKIVATRRRPWSQRVIKAYPWQHQGYIKA